MTLEHCDVRRAMAGRVESDFGLGATNEGRRSGLLEMYNFAFQASLVAGLFVCLSSVYFGTSWLRSCGFVWFCMHSWLSGYRLPITDFNKTIFSVCTCASSRFQSTAVEPTMKAPSIFQRKMLETTRVIARPHRKHRSLGTPFFPHLCAKTPILTVVFSGWQSIR